ncbi:MAG: ArnT family glycosyltransferase [Flammeovirgaceae bacterium]
MLSLKRSTWIYLLCGYSFLYLVIHLYTLSISPLPWFDETYMASIANEFIETGKLFPRVAQVRQMDQELIYGPVYFAITGSFIKLFGLSLVPFRLTTFLSGLLVIGMATQLLKSLISNRKSVGLFAIALSLDPFLTRSMHEGRMDLLALFFVLTASHYFIQFFQTKHVQSVIWAAVFSLLALLTTPRTGFFFTAWLGIWIYWLIKNPAHVLKPALYCLGIVLTGYSLWVWYAFGNYAAFFSYYEQYLMFTRLNLAETSIMKQQYLLIFLGFISTSVGVIRFRQTYFQMTICIALLSILCFYAMVFDQGPYAVFIVPSYYLIIFATMSRLMDS